MKIFKKINIAFSKSKLPYKIKIKFMRMLEFLSEKIEINIKDAKMHSILYINCFISLIIWISYFLAKDNWYCISDITIPLTM